MFTIASAIKMFSGKLEKIIADAGGMLVFDQDTIERFCSSEKIPFKLHITDDKRIVITKR
jgi:hypothetical protein